MAVMNAADVDKNGAIDYEEFIVATINLSKLEREAGCQAAFDHFDTDGDGTITRYEIRQGLKAQAKPCIPPGKGHTLHLGGAGHFVLLSKPVWKPLSVLRTSRLT